MEKKNDQKTMVTDFGTLLYQKGYRAKFGLSHNAGRIYTTGSLRNCLEIFLGDFEQGGRTDPHFELSTYADTAQNLDCTFRLQFDETKGFLVREIDINDKVSRKRKNTAWQITSSCRVPRLYLGFSRSKSPGTGSGGENSGHR